MTTSKNAVDPTDLTPESRELVNPLWDEVFAAVRHSDNGPRMVRAREAVQKAIVQAARAPLEAALKRAVTEGRNVLPSATDDQATVIEQWAEEALASTGPSQTPPTVAPPSEVDAGLMAMESGK